MASEHERDLSIVADLLDYARIKRTAARYAKSQNDEGKRHILLKEAAVMEAAANRLDESHESPGWKVNP